MSENTANNAVIFNPLQAWLLEGQKALFVPDFDTAMGLIEQNVGIGYIPHHLAMPRLNNGQLVKKRCRSTGTPPVCSMLHVATVSAKRPTGVWASSSGRR